jgi:hypothetical protein
MYIDQFDHDQDLVIHLMFHQIFLDKDVHDHKQVYEKFFEILHQLNHLDRKLFKEKNKYYSYKKKFVFLLTKSSSITNDNISTIRTRRWWSCTNQW